MPMRLIDLRCPVCNATKVDHFQRDSAEPLPLCDNLTIVAGDETHRAPCMTPMARDYRPLRNGGVIPDEIPGGYAVKHGLCWPDGTPRVFYSRSEMERVAKEKGRYNHVEHMPSPGSDKNRWGHTVKWDATPVISEEDRLRAWHEHEAQLKRESIS